MQRKIQRRDSSLTRRKVNFFISTSLTLNNPLAPLMDYLIKQEIRRSISDNYSYVYRFCAVYYAFCASWIFFFILVSNEGGSLGKKK